jgi:Flp pilus assembly protein TadG
MTTSLPSRRRLRRAVRRATGTRRRHEDRGASAVEFALVSPLLFTLLFATIDYGLYFADALTVQQRTVDAARDATLSVGSVSANWPGSGSCPVVASAALSASATGDLTKVVCSLSDSIQPIGGGVVVVKAEVVTPAGAPTAVWAPPNRLRVCAQTRHSAVLPMVPMPDGGAITSRTEMPIEPGNAALLLNPVAQDAATVDGDWTWC